MYANGVKYVQNFVTEIPTFLKSQNQKVFDDPRVLFSCVLRKFLFHIAYEIEMSNISHQTNDIKLSFDTYGHLVSEWQASASHLDTNPNQPHRNANTH